MKAARLHAYHDPLKLESIEEPADDGVEEAWSAEIERRLADYRAGRIKTIPWSEVRARLHRADEGRACRCGHELLRRRRWIACRRR